MIPGVALVVGGIPQDMHLGFWLGVASAALAAMFNALNKRYLGHHDAMAVTWLELGAGFLLVALIAPFAAPAGPALSCRMSATGHCCWCWPSFAP